MRPLTILAVFVICSFVFIGCPSGGSGGGSNPVASPSSNVPGSPAVTIDTPTSESSYLSGEDKVSLTGSATDNGAVSAVHWSTNFGFNGTASGTGSWSINDITLMEGDNIVTVSATDDEGLVGDDKIIVTYNKYLVFHGAPLVTPFAVFTNEPTDVITRVAIIPNANLVAGSVKLLEVDAGGTVLADLGQLYDDGSLAHGDDIKGDSVYSAKTHFIEPAAGELFFRVEAATTESVGTVKAWTSIVSLSVVVSIPETEVMVAVDLQEEAQDHYNGYIMTLSKETSLEKTVTWLEQQAGVADAEITASGDIWVEFTNSLTGMVHCGAEGEEGGFGIGKPEVRNGPSIAWENQTTGTGPMTLSGGPSNNDPDAVLNSKALLYAPYYTQFTGWGTEFTDSVQTLLNNAKKPKFKTTYHKNSGATVDALLGLTGYGLIVFHTHGGVDAKGNVLLSTGEVADTASVKKHKARYYTKQLTLATIHGKTYWCILPKFVSSLGGTFPNSIVYTGACASSKTKSLASAFMAKGANTYYGFSETVYGWFDKKMADLVFPKLITENKTTGEAFVPGQKDTHAKPAYFTMDGNPKTYFKAGLINGDFEKGNLTGWTANGDGRVISKLGYVNPWEGGFMGIISTGLGYTTSSGSISQTFWVDPDNTTLTLKWNFLSEEFMEYVGSKYQDYFQIKIIDEQGVSETIFYKAIDDIADGYSLTKVSPDIVFDKGDVWGTGWQFLQWSLYKYADTTVTIELSCGDVGDSIYDTAVLIDVVTDIN